ncbi:SDR family oxidoreductase [Aquibacillus rhizosphaerae]|uniref:SDR family oxidoreductase n=1 Tax=Aquibacillus rhizosphaerae TaxID=3051431 RepID=A0ABT7L7E8_9BACI|nr:SDR family oxidoreductase [Aquibacillus sp. LR5S19]MDL4841787.1 SDR family oxidoreductase [Aquibacillus sp. LR5S19]
MDRNSVVIVTGANSGMGLATSMALARTGATVVMLCRSEKRGKLALDEVKRESGNDSVMLMVCDLGSHKSIADFCLEFKKRYQRLDVLINNAGVVIPGRHQTLDGYELQFGVNHLGHFLLTNMLLEVLIASAPARIINVASGAHKIGKIHFKDVNLSENYTVWRAYAQAKLANILFTYQLAEKLEGTGVTANCLHPGAVATNMGINRKTGFGTYITKLLKPFFQTSAEGAATTIYLATSNDVNGVTGKYFYKKRPIDSSKKSYDKNSAKKIWDLSEDMTGVQRFNNI